MNNDLIEQKSWWKKNWKWFVPLSGISIILIAILVSLGVGEIGTNLVQAYSDTELFENALEKVKSDKRVAELLGEIEPIDKLAILEGVVMYSNENKTVNLSIRIIGTKGKAKMDISADLINNKWDYKKINIRIKKPIENKQIIKIVTTE